MIQTKRTFRINVMRLSMLALMAFSFFLQAGAHSDQPAFDIDTHGFACSVKHDPQIDQMMRGMESKRRVHGYYRPETVRNVIYANDHTCVFRLAVCVSAQVFTGPDFNSDLEKAHSFREELKTFLNELYGRDCGIEFEFVEDDRLFLTENPTYLTVDNATDVINSLIGSERYDLGILIMPDLTRLKGLAILGGVYSQQKKGGAWAVNSFPTIAHELGHVLGANHTHEKDDAKISEQGNGFSIMSYGDSRTFLSMATIREIRHTLAQLGRYTDASRKEFTKGYADTDNAPYIKPFDGVIPQLDRNAIPHEYVVTKGTRYQFYIPVLNQDTEGFKYNAHQFDIGLPGTEYRLTQRQYHPSDQPVVMYHPVYLHPAYGLEAKPLLLRYTDQFETGLYTYCLSAFNHGHHDAVEVKLRIVDGEPFSITGADLGTDLFERVKPGQSKINLTWTPCQELYGTNSKVRILLSDDFGKTFKYVLADEVPNNGKWSGVFPYVKIGQKYEENSLLNVRAGVIKVEVIGEAAYAVTKEEPYLCRGIEVIPTGGFITKDDTPVNFSPAPDVYLEVNDENEIGDAPELTASSGGSSIKVEAVETRTDHTVCRTWTALLDGREAVYTQVIKIRRPAGEDEAVYRKTRMLTELSNELYHHIGDLGYPKEGLPLCRQLKEIYPKVFTADGHVRNGLLKEDVETLEQVLEEIGKMEDESVVMPTVGKRYKIASYHEKFGEQRYFYLQQPESSETDPKMLRDDPQQGVEWFAGWVDDMYRFTANGMALHLAQTSRNLTGMKLTRGYTWGSFCFISGDETRLAQVNETGEIISFNDRYADNPVGYKANRSDLVISTDFRLFEISDDHGTEDQRTHSVRTDGHRLASVYLDYPVTIPEGLDAYSVETVRDEDETCRLHLTGLTDFIPAHTPTLLCSAEPFATYVLTETEQDLPRAKDKNMFGSLMQLDHAVLNEDYLYFPLTTPQLTDEGHTVSYALLGDNGDIAAHTAYVRLYKYADDNLQVKTAVLDLTEAGISTGIIPATAVPADATWVYDLKGRRLAHASHFGRLPKGIYIVDGRKVVK